MSYQVGAACYATVAHAGGAACSNFSPVSSLVEDGAVLRTVSCGSADPDTGALNLTVTSSPVAGGVPTSVVVHQSIQFPECQQAAYVEAGKALVPGVLGIIVTIWIFKQFISFLNWGRGDTL